MTRSMNRIKGQRQRREREAAAVEINHGEYNQLMTDWDPIHLKQQLDEARSEVIRLEADNKRLGRLWAMNVERNLGLRAWLQKQIEANESPAHCEWVLAEMDRLEAEITEAPEPAHAASL